MLIFHELTQYRVGLGLNAFFESRVRKYGLWYCLFLLQIIWTRLVPISASLLLNVPLVQSN